MAAASKELLKLEQQERRFVDLNLLVCNKEKPLPRNQKGQLQTSGNAEGNPITTPVPTSQVLGKVKDFLGVMAEANKRLERSALENSRSNYDIEVLSGNETECIEMDLLLGVADLHTPEAIAAATAAMGGSQPSLPFPNGSCNSDTVNSDDDSDLEDGEANGSAWSKESSLDETLSVDRPTKRPKILVLN